MNSFSKRSLVLAGLLALIIVPSVKAEDSNSGKREGWKKAATAAYSKIEGRKDKKLEKCEAVQAKLEAKTTDDNRLEGKHRQQYEKLVARIESLITRADAASYDTTDLKAQLIILEEKIEKFKTDKDTYIAALKASKTAVCGKMENEFKDSLVSTRTEREQLKADVADIHDYVKNVIKPSVRALKKMVNASASPAASASPSPSASPEL